MKKVLSLQRSRLIGLFSLATMVFLCGCRDNTNTGGGQRKQKIAFVVTTLSNPFFVDMTAGAKAQAEKEGVELIVQAPEKAVDDERQIQIIENLITQKVNAICVVPANSKSIIEVVAKANRAGIPIINIDNKIDASLAKEKGVKIAAYVGSDNFQGGKLAGEFVAKRLGGKGTVAILEGVSGVEAGIKRKDGFLDAIKAYSGIKVVASQPADWEREKGLNVFQNILQSHPDLGALFACNDEMALGAIRAFNGPRKTLVVGFDAIKDALDAVKNGDLDATVAQQPMDMGRIAIETAMTLLKGKEVDSIVLTGLKLIIKD